MARKLTLKKETLVELTAEDLRDVVGGDASGTTCPVKVCLASDDNCAPSFNRSCLPTCYCTPQTV